MGKSKIEWTERTWNPVTGCDRCSPGCDNCYALSLAKRLKAMGAARYQNDGNPRTSGPGFGVTLHHDVLDVPLRRRTPTVWFVNSMSDLFHPDVPDAFVAEVFAVMAACPQHTFQVLTKRPQRMWALLNAVGVDGDVWRFGSIERLGPWPLPNVWLGVSIEQDRWSFRASYLRDTPAAVRFVSAEPLLGPLPSLDLAGIDWLIVGGESGVGARPMELDWVRQLRDLCADRTEPCEIPDVPRPHSVQVEPGGFRACACSHPAPVAFFVKQLSSGGMRPIKDITQFPEDLRIRDYPEAISR